MREKDAAMTSRSFRGCVFLGLGLWLLVMLPGPASADAAPEVGLIHQIDGYSDNAVIERDGATVPVKLLAPVHTGDILRVHAPGTRVTIRLPSGRERSVETPNAPLLIDDSGTPPTWGGNVRRWIMEWLTTTHDNEVSLVSAASRGKSGALSCPFLLWDGRAQRLAAPVRHVDYEWEGGTPPYAVTVTGRGGTTIERWDLRDPAVGLDLPENPPGLETGTITVHDAAGRSCEIGFESVGPDAVPASPSWLSTVPDTQIREFLSALQLADHDKGAWRFEAYQRLVRLGRDWPEALHAANTIRRGGVVEVPAQ